MISSPPDQIAAVVLAAGASTRYPPGNKLSAPIEGVPLLEHTLRSLLEERRLDPVYLVLGADFAELQKMQFLSKRVRAVHNTHWPEGIASSIRCGVAAARQANGIVLTLGDTPFFKSSTLEALLPHTPPERLKVRVPVYGGRRGHPVYFPACFYPQLLKLRGDRGAKVLLRRHSDLVQEIAVEDAGILRDFDSQADFQL